MQKNNTHLSRRTVDTNLSATAAAAALSIGTSCAMLAGVGLLGVRTSRMQQPGDVCLNLFRRGRTVENSTRQQQFNKNTARREWERKVFDLGEETLNSGNRASRA